MFHTVVHACLKIMAPALAFQVLGSQAWTIAPGFYHANLSAQQEKGLSITLPL